MKKTRTLLLALSLGLGMNAFAEEEPESWIIKFEHGGQTEYITQQEAEEAGLLQFTADKGETGIITFSEEIKQAYPDGYMVKTAFVLNGENFTIDTSGADIAFAMPMANYDTNFTVKGGKGGSITTLGDAAFKSVTVESGTFYVGNPEGDGTTLSQIGVTDSFTVKSDAALEITKGGKMLLTDQIQNAGSVTINGVIDASNLTHEAAQRVGVIFVDTEGTVGVENGFLYGGKHPETGDPIVWNVTTGTGTTNASEGAYIAVATKNLPLNEDGQVEMQETKKDIWFQNNGTLESVGTVTTAGGTGVAIVVNTNSGDTTTLKVDIPLSTSNTVYTVRGSNVLIDLYSGYWPGGVGNLTVLDGANVHINPTSGLNGQLSTLKFVGQDIRFDVVGTPPSWWDTAEGRLAPINMVVESASAASVKADILPFFGYYKRDVVQAGEEPEFGIINIKGDLTLLTGSEMDLRLAAASPTGYEHSRYGRVEGDQAKDVVYEEEFSHLNIANGGALLLNDDAKLLVATVEDGATITEDGNLDTSRNLDSVTLVEGNLPSYEQALEAAGETKPYEINGTVEITSLGQNKEASITSNGATAAHYTSRNSNYTVQNASITVVDEFVSGYDMEASEMVLPLVKPKTDKGNSNTTISNVLIGDSVTNDKSNGNGKVTLDNAANRDFNTLYAKEGDIDITNRKTVKNEYQESILEPVNAKTVHIGAGKTVSVSGTLEAAAAKATLNVTNLLQADGYKGNGPDEPSYSVIDANLRLGVGATLNVTAANGIGGIDMNGNTVTFGYESDGSRGAKLYWADYDSIMGMATGSKYDLFWNVSGVDLSDFGAPSGNAFTENDEIKYDASLYFTNLPSDNFYLCYSGVNSTGGNGNNVGTIYIYKWGNVTPEPTTGTLSLLALAGLAARRRRK